MRGDRPERAGPWRQMSWVLCRPAKSPDGRRPPPIVQHCSIILTSRQFHVSGPRGVRRDMLVGLLLVRWRGDPSFNLAMESNRVANVPTEPCSEALPLIVDRGGARATAAGSDRGAAACMSNEPGR